MFPIKRKINNYHRPWNYLLVFLLLATSGFMYFYSNDEYIAIGLFISLVIFLNRGLIEKIDGKFVFILLLFVLWEIIQGIYFHSLLLKPIVGTFGRFLFAYLVIKSVGTRFIDTYVNIIYFLSIISLIFYVLFFFPQIINQLVASAITQPLFPLQNQHYPFIPNYVLVTFNDYKALRNSGPFWEPGAFSVFLNIAFLLNIISKNKLLSKKNVIFFITTLTTLSTVGFLTLFFIITSAYYLLNPHYKKIFLLVPMILLIANLIVNIPFLLPKVQQNIEIADYNTSSRFGSALADYHLIYKNPILGYGRNLENKYHTSFWNVKIMHRNNGITDFITQWGLLLFLFYFASYKKSSNVICTYFNSNQILSIVFIISILLLGFSQGLFKYPFFHSLMFLQFSYNHLTFNRAIK